MTASARKPHPLRKYEPQPKKVTPTADGKGVAHISKVGKIEKLLEELEIKKLGEFSYPTDANEADR